MTLASPAVDAELVLAIDVPLDLRLVFAPLRHGTGDPTISIEERRVARATRTPDGPAGVAYERLADDKVRVRAWGPGASWAVERAAAALGLGDDPGALDRLERAHPHALVRELARRFAALRLGRTDAVFESLLPAIVEQKVTGDEARRGYRLLVRRYGEPAPGPLGLRLAPAPWTLAALPYHAFHPLGIEQRRADRVRRAAERTAWLEEACMLPLEVAYARLRSIVGVGAWTAAEVGRSAFGDPDAVSVGDYNLPHAVCWALAREPRGDDARMLDLLEPYRGQRGRVVRLIEAAGIRAPRRGPRMAPRAIAAI